jgi:IMP cyclohydrolase
MAIMEIIIEGKYKDMDFIKKAQENEIKLKKNVYPGRGIIIGETKDRKNYVQVYWIMGRSINSRNRVFEVEEGNMRTKAYDELKLTDPSLVIYYPSRTLNNKHIITNGDQTDTIYNYLKDNKSFKDALDTREFEPDGPNFTPRISGIVDLDDKECAYMLSILKTEGNDENNSRRQYFSYEKAIPGIGHCITTYSGDGDPLPSFLGEPYVLRIFDTIEENLRFYWESLNEDNKVSLMVKFIDKGTRKGSIKIINKLS